MARTFKIEVKDGNPVGALNGFLKEVLSGGEISAMLVSERLPMKKAVMPALVSDPERLDSADPLAPAFPLNAARLLSRLTRKPIGGKIAALLRPCEIRAFVELVKLKQGSLDEVVLIGIDCLGAYGNLNYAKFAKESNGDSTKNFFQNMIEGRGAAFADFDISPACKACEHPVPEISDLSIGFLGVEPKGSFILTVNTEKGESAVLELDLPNAPESPGRKAAIADLVSQRKTYRDKMFDETEEAVSDLQKLMETIGNCVNCYNCRAACPVCYCKECVFLTDVFDHEPSQYLRWARRKGLVKMPTDTVFFHLTRLSHMSAACIGCGQCSNACPNNVPVMEIFRTIANHTQKAFDYEAGRSLDEEPPLSTFREREFSEVTGGKD